MLKYIEDSTILVINLVRAVKYFKLWCLVIWEYNCGTGVSFSRNPVTGEDELFGEYLINAQGEDVVAGIKNS